MTRKEFLIYFSLISIVLTLSFSNCSNPSSSNTESSNSNFASTAACTTVSDSLRSPNSIAQVMNLINALPKPLSMDCFLLSLKKPLKVFATSNTFSAQPAYNLQNPRIFILNTRLSLSVVPAGSGKFLLELSEKENSNDSIKAEVEFPIQAPLDGARFLQNIADQNKGTSRCVTCHSNEHSLIYGNVGPAFSSLTIRPNEAQRVYQTFMKNQASNCNFGIDPYRCNMLKAIYIDGEAADDYFLF